MTRTLTALLSLCLAATPALAASPTTPNWSLKADYIDACSCDLACPCIFGGPSTHGYCKGTTLVEIKEGHYGQIDYADVTVLAVYNSGKWIKFFVSDNATKEQTDAVPEFFPTAEGFFDAPVREVKNLPITVTRTKDKISVTAEGTTIELEQVQNANGDPIKISGLPAQGFPGLPYLDHTQYKTTALTHESENENFNFAATNAYTAKINASSDQAEE